MSDLSKKAVVVACIQGSWDTRRGYRFSGSQEVTETSMILEAAQSLSGYKLLLVDDKSGPEGDPLTDIPRWVHRRFSYANWWREAELAQLLGTAPKSLGQVCLVSESGRCSCGGILHQLLIRMRMNFPKYAFFQLIVPAGCHAAVEHYLEEVWTEEEREEGDNLLEIEVVTPKISGKSGCRARKFRKE